MVDFTPHNLDRADEAAAANGVVGAADDAPASASKAVPEAESLDKPGSPGRDDANEKNATESADPKQTIPFLQLFAYADSLDYLLMALGSVGAIVHGLALPMFFLFFGKLLNGFGSNRNNPKKAAETVSEVSLHPNRFAQRECKAPGFFKRLTCFWKWAPVIAEFALLRLPWVSCPFLVLGRSVSFPGPNVFGKCDSRWLFSSISLEL